MFGKYSNQLNKTNQHLTNAAIAAFINLKDNLSEKEISFIENHLNKCEDCKNRLDKMIEEDIEIDSTELQNYKITRLKDLPDGSQDYKIKKLKNNSTRYYYWAAAALLIIAAGMFYIFQPDEEKIIVQNNIPETDSIIAGNKNKIENLSEDKKNTKEETKDYNESDFAANVIMENFIDRNVRSEGTIKIISPKMGDTLKTPVFFKWENNAAGSIKFELVNNRNKSILKQTLAENYYTYQNDLNPGLYYWKVFIDNKFETVGKFYVRNK